MSTAIQQYLIPITSVGTPYPVLLAGNLIKHVRFSNNNLNMVLFSSVENSGQPHPEYTRYFLVVATGVAIPPNIQYVGTSDSSPSGNFYHVFEMASGWSPA